MKVDSLSVFFPAFNEEKNIQKTLEKAFQVLETLPLKNYEVLVINDGSKDQTAKILENLKKKYFKLNVITHQFNKGYGEALKSGFYNAKYPWIVFTDSDGQFDFSEVIKFLEKSSEADLVVGYRIDRQDSLLRVIFGWGWTTISNVLLGIKVRDVDCAFKLVRKEVVDRIPKLRSSRGAMVSPELLAKAQKEGFKIVEIGVHHYPRTGGRQTGANLKVIVKSFADLFRLWWKIK